MSNPYDFGTMASIPPDAAPPSVLSQGAPGVLSQQDPVLSVGRDQAMIDAKAAAERAERSLDQREEFMRRRAQALSPLRDAQMRSAVQPQPQQPQQQAPPKPPSAEDAQKQTWQQEWLTAAMFLGVLAGGMTRRPLTNSLAAFTGMVEGVNEGQKQKFEQSMKTWEAENKRVLEANDQANKAYERILKARDLDNEQKLLMLQIEAARWDDDPMAQAATTRDRIAVAQLFDARRTYGADLKAGQERQKQEAMQRNVELRMQDPAFERSAQNIANYREPLRPIARTRNETSMYNEALNDRAREILANQGQQYDATKFTERQSGARITGTTDPMTIRRTEIAFAVGPEARSVRSLNVAVDHLSFLDTKLIPALKTGDINEINKYKNKLQEEFGATAPTNFDAAKQIIGQEVIKAVVNNGGGVTERQEAARFIQNSRSMDQLHDLVRVYERLMGGQLHGLQQQYEGGGGRKDFNAVFLRSETRDALDRVFTGEWPEPPNEMRDHLQRLADKLQQGGGEIATKAAGAIESGMSGPAVNRYGQTRDQTSLWQEFTRWLKDNGGSITPMPPQPGP